MSIGQRPVSVVEEETHSSHSTATCSNIKPVQIIIIIIIYTFIAYDYIAQ